MPIPGWRRGTRRTAAEEMVLGQPRNQSKRRGRLLFAWFDGRAAGATGAHAPRGTWGSGVCGPLMRSLVDQSDRTWGGGRAWTGRSHCSRGLTPSNSSAAPWPRASARQIDSYHGTVAIYPTASLPRPRAAQQPGRRHSKAGHRGPLAAAHKQIAELSVHAVGPLRSTPQAQALPAPAQPDQIQVARPQAASSPV